jgi:hypothetical protein
MFRIGGLVICAPHVRKLSGKFAGIRVLERKFGISNIWGLKDHPLNMYESELIPINCSALKALYGYEERETPEGGFER